MTTPNSPDISIFNFKPVWDLSAVLPVLKIENQSSGDILGNVSYWFEAYTGGGLLFHQGSEGTPDETGVWATFDVPEEIPQIMGHVEWSGIPFKVKGYAKDLAGTIFSFEKETSVPRPSGNVGHANNFGVGNLEILIKCEKARIYVEDRTDYGYCGLGGTIQNKLIKLIYPPDSTNVAPAPKEVENVNNALLPISRNGDGYIIALASVYQYDFTNGSAVKIRYTFQSTFPVRCNIDLCPLICDIQKLEERYERNGCNADERMRLTLINSKLNRAMMAKFQPLCGFSVSAIVDEIKALGGFTCDCTGSEFNGTNGILPLLNEDTAVICADVYACFNELLNTLDPKCLASQGEWEGMSLGAKWQRIINNFCCSAIVDIQQA